MPHTVFAYYYPWFSGAPGYRHWSAPTAGRVVGSSIPVLGAYDSRDTALALEAHMQWAQAAKIDVLVLSWWGRGGYEDSAVLPIMNKAAQHGIKVAFMIDTYPNRTAASTAQDIAYIYSTYGSLPAFYRVSRSTQFGPTTNPRGMFFVYAPSGSGWSQAFDSLRGTANDAILLVRTDDNQILSDAGVTAQMSSLHADGMFNYGYYAYPYQHMALPSSPNYLLVFAVQPGFDNTLNGGTLQLGRNKGATYDQVWQSLIAQKPEAVGIDSFNEWGETSQIEPALPNSYGPYPHLDYEGDYGLSGLAAAGAYITRSATWAQLYKGA
jgi:glycoprotein endo-alpha-1,2-mannosidase